MKLLDYAPNVLAALLAGPLNQGDLSEAVFGTSGRGNQYLRRSLFPLCVRMGWIALAKKGKTKLFSLTDLGRKALGPGDPHANWDFTSHKFKS